MKHKDDEFVKDHSERDWDGYGAKPLNLKSYEFACAFIDAWPSDMRQPELSCHNDGDVSLYWQMGTYGQIFVGISDRGFLTYASFWDHKIKIDRVCEFNGKTIPEHFMRVFELVCAESGVSI